MYNYFNRYGIYDVLSSYIDLVRNRVSEIKYVLSNRRWNHPVH